ncbi:MAG: alcohol dehydrogenase catalytic domain-containing protein [Desulfatitalea sp.]|nr:alcohol dehydrogenase catalytic domain-containing protein [Desulfatitalea sp.]NNJ99168.1 alcohol dehydrogenase catalytic domain-containing protein [Desulfatitalea sp.]
MRMVLTGPGRLVVENGCTDAALPETGFIAVRVLCCAICRTDAKMWAEGHRDLVMPRVLGHEMVVEDANGQRYVVWPGQSCGACRCCLSGRENLCETMRITGFHRDGGFADRVELPEESLVSISKALDVRVACLAEPVGCVINAFEKLIPHPNDRVLIYGAGTMGLITAAYAQHLGLVPLVIEKRETKITRVTPFLSATGIDCRKKTREGEFDIVINACADYMALCNGIEKIGRGGQLSFFSGLTKDEHIETNLINLLHYKEVRVTGVYGLTRAHLVKAVAFIAAYEATLSLLIETMVPAQTAPDLMPKVLCGDSLKYVLDFREATPQH